MYFGHAFALENWALFTTFPIGAGFLLAKEGKLGTQI